MGAVSPVRPGSGPFRRALEEGRLVLFDGAMGTMLYAKGVFIHRAFEQLNLEEPVLVREVHEAYLAAGAAVLETNTFAANRFRLSPHGAAEQVEAINARGVELARAAAGGRAWVAGAIGPLGVRIEPFGPIGREEARAVFEEQAKALAIAGVDLFVLETFAHLPEIVEAIRAVRAVSPDLPIVAQVQVAGHGVTREGVDAAEAAAALVEAGADAAGVNCSEALATLDALERMRTAVSVPLSGQPNAGQPRSVEGRNIYLASPEYLVAWARRAVRAGVRLVGGCCGTGPEHIRALATLAREATPQVKAEEMAPALERQSTKPPVPAAERSGLARALAEGKFVRGVEMPPPRGWKAGRVIAVAAELSGGGPRVLSLREDASGRASPPPAAIAPLCHAAGVETLVQYSCRGRRLARIQSDLLGGYATGVKNLLIITGPPLTPGAEQDAWKDLEVDSIGAINLVRRLNQGEDIGGNPIGEPTAFHVGVRLDPTAYDLEREVSRYRWKHEAGAEFAVTVPVFDPAALKTLLDRLEGIRLPVIATVWPLTSAREAEFFEHEQDTAPVPAALVERMRRAEEQGRELDEGLAIARELAAAVRPMVQGLLVAAPLGRAELAISVLDAVG